MFNPREITILQVQFNKKDGKYIKAQFTDAITNIRVSKETN